MKNKWIAVLPKNYRRIVLAAIERAADPVLFMNGERVTDFSQAGPISCSCQLPCRSNSYIDRFRCDPSHSSSGMPFAWRWYA